MAGDFALGVLAFGLDILKLIWHKRKREKQSEFVISKRGNDIAEFKPVLRVSKTQTENKDGERR